MWRIRTPDCSPDCLPYPPPAPFPPAFPSPPGSVPHAPWSQPSSPGPTSPTRHRDISWLCWGGSAQVGMNDLFFLSQHTVNPAGRLNMSLMMFIPADEVQLGRWALAGPGGRGLLKAMPPPPPHCPGLPGRWEGLSCWAPHLSPSFLPGWHWSFLPRVPIGHCPQGSNSGGVGGRGMVGPGTWPLRPWVLCPTLHPGLK